MFIVRKKKRDLYKLFNLKRESHTSSQGGGGNEPLLKRSSIKMAQFQTGLTAKSTNIKTAHFYVTIKNN